MNLDLTLSIFCTLVIGFVFVRMFWSYSSKRHKRHYSQGRIKAPSIAIFNLISKLMFMSGMSLTLVSFWLTSPFFLAFHQYTIIQVIGTILVLFGYIRLNQSFDHLGNNYSPSFDAYMPTSIVTDGNYKLIRHPIYLYNLFISFGLALASGSSIVAFNAIIGLLFLLRIINMEEAYLIEHFPNYQQHTKESWRLIPYVY